MNRGKAIDNGLVVGLDGLEQEGTEKTEGIRCSERENRSCRLIRGIRIQRKDAKEGVGIRRKRILQEERCAKGSSQRISKRLGGQVEGEAVRRKSDPAKLAITAKYHLNDPAHG